MKTATILFFTFSVLSVSFCFSQPTISCQGNQIRSADTTLCTYTSIGTEFNPLSYTGSGATIAYTLSGVTTGSGFTLAGIVFNKGTTTVLWNVTDSVMNSATCSFLVTVNDNENPGITCPYDQLRCHYLPFDPCNYYCTVGTEFDPISFYDNCAGTSIIYNLSGPTTGNGSNTLAGIVFNLLSTNVLWTVTDSSGNTATCSFNVLVDFCAVGITENSNNGLINIYPNPSNDKITIESPLIRNELIIRICNIQGQLLLQQIIQQDKIEIDISKLDKGMYIARVLSKDINVVKKIIRE